MKKDILENNPSDRNRVASRLNQLGKDGMVAARGLDDLGKGDIGNKVARDASAQYIEKFKDMLADTLFGPKLMVLMKQFDAQQKKDLDNSPQQELPGMDVASVENSEEPVNENFAYGMPGQDEDKETVTYSKTKKQGDASVTVSANADSMGELHDILKLAGIDFDGQGDAVPGDAEDEDPEKEDVLLKPEHDHDDHEHDAEPCANCGEMDCDCDDGCGHDNDGEKPKMIVVSPAMDKNAIFNSLKAKLQDKLSS